MQEGLRAGAFNRVESQIVQQALELDRLTVGNLMTPRPKIIWLNVNDPPMTGQPSVPLPVDGMKFRVPEACTPQSCAFRDHHAELKALNVGVFGVSTQIDY